MVVRNPIRALRALPFILCIMSCGTGEVEKVTADSTVTSSSVMQATAPDVVNTDTTTAAPVAIADTIKKPDSTKPRRAIPPKKAHKS